MADHVMKDITYFDLALHVISVSEFDTAIIKILNEKYAVKFL